MPKTYYCCENNSKKNNNIDYDNNYNDNDNDINNFFKDISQSQSQSQSQSTKKYSKHHSISNTLKNTLHCINLDTTFNIPKHTKTTNTTMNYAIITLLFGNSYLPGILLLGSSIRKVMPNEYKKYIQLCCMVTNDVTPESRSMISKIYDRIIDVKYIQIPTNLIDHKDELTRNTYSKTFTKLRIFEFTEYEKVLFLDADMLVVKDEIFSLFNLRTPASIFLGKLSNNPKDRYFKDEDQLQIFKDKYCKTDGIHGKLIPYSSFDNEKASQGMNIETSVLLISPNIKLVLQRDKFLNNIRNNKTMIKGDTEMISRMFKDNIYAIEPRFFGRWANPDKNPEIVILDLYGNKKPWDNKYFKDLLQFENVGDISYWWRTYISVYNSDYKHYDNKLLDNLYNNILHISDLKNIYKTNINIDIGNYLCIYFCNLGLSIIEKKAFTFKLDNVNFIKNLPSFIKYDDKMYNKIYNKIHTNFKLRGITLNIMKDIVQHQSNILWFMSNNINYNFWICMKDLIYKILDEALIKSNLKKQIDYPVIHFRCADTPFARHSKYHFQKYKFYKEILNKINIDTNTNYNKIILLSCSFHRSDNNIKKACDIYTNSLSDYLKSINYSSQIECKSNIEDFATLFYAPAVISISSSFSFMSGFFGKGIFYSAGLQESDKKTNCTLCNNFLINKYNVKHSSIDDYYDTQKVISILES